MRSSSIVTGLLSTSAIVLPYLITLSARARMSGGIVSSIWPRGIPRRFLLLVSQQIHLASEPAIQMYIVEASSGKRHRPYIAPRDRKYDATQRVVTGDRTDALFCRL